MELEIILERLEDKHGELKANDYYLDFTNKYDKRHKDDPGSCRQYDDRRNKVFERYARRWYGVY